MQFQQSRNNSGYKHCSPFYHPLNILPNSAIMDCDKMVSDVDKEFVAPFDDKFHSDNINWCILQREICTIKLQNLTQFALSAAKGWGQMI